jgi:glycosyltransferase involved in cell wall biosynthesis
LKPRISVIVPCYNQARYLDECLDSVLTQTYENWECIIVNDGSPDNTEEIASKWVEKDTRFIYLKKENGGLSSARNFGIEKAGGEFILPLDADDKIDSTYIHQALLEFERQPTLKLVYCLAQKFGFENEFWSLPEFSLKSLALQNIIFCSAVYRKVDWQHIGGYDPNLTHGLEDWDFWLSLLKTGGEVKRLEFIGFFYRTKPDSMSINLRKKNSIIISSQDYIYLKHKEFYDKEFGTYLEVLRIHDELRKENDRYLKFLNNPLIKSLLKFKKYYSKN